MPAYKDKAKGTWYRSDPIPTIRLQQISSKAANQ